MDSASQAEEEETQEQQARTVLHARVVVLQTRALARAVIYGVGGCLLEGTDEGPVGGRVAKAFRPNEEKDEGKRLMVSRVA